MKEYIAEYIIPVEEKGRNQMFDFTNAKRLIRCRDCKWYVPDEYEADYGDCTNDMGMCNSFVYGNDYCSQAERRGEE